MLSGAVPDTVISEIVVSRPPDSGQNSTLDVVVYVCPTVRVTCVPPSFMVTVVTATSVTVSIEYVHDGGGGDEGGTPGGNGGGDEGGVDGGGANGRGGGDGDGK